MDNLGYVRIVPFKRQTSYDIIFLYRFSESQTVFFLFIVKSVMVKG